MAEKTGQDVGLAPAQTVKDAGEKEKPPAKLGKGLDVGTANLVCALVGYDGKIVLRRERNAFLDIKADPFTRSMLNEQKVPYAVYKNLFLVLGQAAFEFANVAGRDVRRTMQGGLINSKEVDALPVFKLLIEKLLGPPRKESESVCFSLPATPVDSNISIDYHKGILMSLLTRFG
jgi:hypothetical protein